MVVVRNFRGKDKWQRGTVILRIGPLAYQVRVGERMCHVHIDHLLPAGDAEFTSNTPEQKVIPLTSVVPPPVLPVPSGVTPFKSLEPTFNSLEPTFNSRKGEMFYFGLYPVCIIWDAHIWIASCKGFRQ